jgi:hypothetical protein
MAGCGSFAALEKLDFCQISKNSIDSGCHRVDCAMGTGIGAMQYGIPLGIRGRCCFPPWNQVREEAHAGNSIGPVAAGLICALLLGFVEPASAQAQKFDFADIRSARHFLHRLPSSHVYSLLPIGAGGLTNARSARPSRWRALCNAVVIMPQRQKMSYQTKQFDLRQL